MKLVDCYLTVRVMFSRCARSINLVNLFPYEDCPGAGTENLVDFSKVSLAARDGLVYADAGLFSAARFLLST